jgi:hypothetical protein
LGRGVKATARKKIMPASPRTRQVYTSRV